MLSCNNNNPIRVAQKLANESVLGQTALQDDSELQIPLEAGRRYAINGHIVFALDGAASGYKFRLGAPGAAGALMRYSIQIYNCVLGTLVNSATMSLGTPFVEGALASIGDHVAIINGQAELGAADATLVFRFAQSVSDAAAIRTLRTSFLQVIDFGGG